MLRGSAARRRGRERSSRGRPRLRRRAPSRDKLLAAACWSGRSAHERGWGRACRSLAGRRATIGELHKSWRRGESEMKVKAPYWQGSVEVAAGRRPVDSCPFLSLCRMRTRTRRADERVGSGVVVFAHFEWEESRRWRRWWSSRMCCRRATLKPMTKRVGERLDTALYCARHWRRPTWPCLRSTADITAWNGNRLHFPIPSMHMEGRQKVGRR
ncbi:hypothetical protein P280DRAFT_108611 [Massarina eburnea CBS 473.64]|uniref:Uncharacterized protein n=1 Tax=Massarina eburnea CBS 473.64 TaxID=1395130 RepID=A0A6A6RR29_9PLEO|nr:hypothetical protein P280DRAFT_108611 [Massarina eburnea CBS 473.64]